ILNRKEIHTRLNNKRFSSSAPYNLTQKQKKSAGSLLLGTFGSLYAIDADSLIFPDSLMLYTTKNYHILQVYHYEN
ncbi:MAG: DUF4421 family protein, partial [Nanoarchaeota archaeon]